MIINNMKNLVKYIGRGIAPLVLGGALALGSCASGKNVQVNNLKGRDLNPANARQEVYSSPVIPSDYGFRVIDRNGNVDETKPIYEKDGRLYVVGFSNAHSTEQFARDMAENDARGRAVQYLFKPKIVKNKDGSTKQTFSGILRNFLCSRYEFVTVRDKSNSQGVIVEALCEIPLENYRGKK